MGEKTMKKWILALLCVLILTSCVSMAYAAKSGDYEYRVYKGNVTITAYNGKAKTVTIPAEIDGKPVTVIGEKAFEPAQYTLEKVIIPDSVVELKDSAFNKCSRMTEITIPDSLVTLEGNPFRYCYNLRTVNISPSHPAIAVVEGVIYSKADRRLVCFPAWKNLTEFTVPQGIEIISQHAFCNNSDLVHVYLPDSLVEIQAGAFDGCNKIADMVFPESLTKIGEMAFFGIQGMKEVAFSGNLVEIGTNAFSFCSVLDTVTIAEGEKALTIKKSAFSNSPIKKIEIHRNVTIGEKAFDSCKNLQEITLDGTVKSIGEEAFSFCTSLKSIEIPGDLTVLEDMVFFNCTSLKEVKLPDTITKVKYNVFSDCSALKTVNFPRSITDISSSSLFEDCPNVTVTVAKSSLGESYCIQNNVKYVYEEEDSSPDLSWLQPAAPTACPACGYEFPEGSSFRFCPNCGQGL